MAKRKRLDERTAAGMRELDQRHKEMLKSFGMTQEQWDRLDALDHALEDEHIYFGWFQFLEFVMLGKGSAEEIAASWAKALNEDFT